MSNGAVRNPPALAVGRFKTLLSIDLDYYNTIDKKTYLPLKELVSHAKLKAPFVFMDHHHPVDYINENNFQRIISVDQHDDISDPNNYSGVHCGNWVSHVKGVKEFIWVPPKKYYVYCEDEIYSWGDWKKRWSGGKMKISKTMSKRKIYRMLKEAEDQRELEIHLICSPGYTSIDRPVIELIKAFKNHVADDFFKYHSERAGIEFFRLFANFCLLTGGLDENLGNG